MKGVSGITNVITLADYRERKAERISAKPDESVLTHEQRAEYAALKQEYAEVLLHGVIDACIETGCLSFDFSRPLGRFQRRDLADRLDSLDVPVCTQEAIAVLVERYTRDVLRVASLAVDFQGFLRLDLESGDAIKWRRTRG